MATKATKKKETKRISRAEKPAKPSNIKRMVEELRRGVPDSVWDELPSDLGKYSDYYLYGGVKE